MRFARIAIGLGAIGFGVHSIIVMLGGERDLTPWSNRFGAPVTPLFAVVFAVFVLVAMVTVPDAPESKSKRKTGGRLFRPFKRR